ncbi:MAG TPA: SpoIIE family protein phosphatase, partial [Leptospiraceae bacterium]|nr:SpoIIE family protein phosphatase [Leptospiraceae bacterium]
ETPVFFIFQLMFCGTAATIVSGAVAERMKFSAYLIVTALISSTIYPLFGHWAWGKNLGDWSSLSGWLGKLGFVDFAGSTVVHSVGGWVGLVAMILIGSRKGRFAEDGTVRNITGHNLPIAMLGTLILWFGWIGFNGGSTLAFSAQIPGIIANTMLSAAGGMGSALIYGWIRLKYAEATLPLNGALAGLVAVTASCHAVTPFEAMIIGFIAGILMFETRMLLERLRMDDAVGAIPVHLTGGIWGTFAAGVFGNTEILGTGLGRTDQILVQIYGILGCAGVSFVISFSVLGFINKFFPFRVPEENEMQGLNYSEHRATTELSDLFLEMEYQKTTGDLSRNVTVEPFTEVGQIAERYNLVLDKVRSNLREKEELTKELEMNLKVIQGDLSTAGKIQSGILTEGDRDVGKFHVSVHYIPLTEVGGDFFDAAEIRPGVLRVFLADATGHGVQAALITMAIKTIYESLKKNAVSPNELLYSLNNEYMSSFGNLSQFFTCAVFDIDADNQRVEYSSAGHIPQILVTKGTVQRMEKTGRIIGVIENSKYAVKSLRFEKQDSMFLFTDGLLEEWNELNEEFGEERLEEILKRDSMPVGKRIEEALLAQKKFRGSIPVQDDITVIGIQNRV